MSGHAPSEPVAAAQLLRELRRQIGESSIEFKEPPRRILGGFEAFTYSFELVVGQGDLSGPLILRLFPETSDAARGRKEAAFQNALHSLDYPAPRVVFHSDAGIGGLPFNLMKRVPGSPMLAGMALDQNTVQQASVKLGEVHARLHNIPSGPVIAALEESGFKLADFSANRQFAGINRYFEDHGLEWLRPGMEWLLQHRPEGESIAVCHGDFHPGNIMVESGEVTGVIDWPGAALASPEHDVGTTIVLIKVAAGAVYPEARPMLEFVASTYLSSYQALAPLDMERVDYHTARRCFRAFVRGTASQVDGIRSDLLPRGGYPWANESAMLAARAELLRITGLDLPTPTDAGL